MRILLSDTGKRYNREWIFRHLTYTFESGKAYAITGSNGSGKSTLLQILSGALTHSEGTVTYTLNNHTIEPDRVYRQVSLAAPYLELPEELTLIEFLEFHAQFKPWRTGIQSHSIPNLIGLASAAQKQLRYYSSGMKQRVKLAQALFSDTAAVLLDEPCTNLDTEGYTLYHKLIQEYGKDRLILVSSNDTNEYTFCSTTINLTEWKPANGSLKV
jgi:ABC-type multidrug transport system ATPase subunit